MCPVIDFLFFLPLSPSYFPPNKMKAKSAFVPLSFSLFLRPSLSPQINKLALFKPLKDKESGLQGIFAGDFFKANWKQTTVRRYDKLELILGKG